MPEEGRGKADVLRVLDGHRSGGRVAEEVRVDVLTEALGCPLSDVVVER
jgi:hypothetical protein